MRRLILPMSMLSLLSIGAIFGFFYAWVCSTMWGLDATDPGIAIAAMQAMNASVRNPVFFPAFFLTPVLLAATSILVLRFNRKRSAILFALGAALYLAGAFFVTAMVNVPMNEALADVIVPIESGDASSIWQSYSESWQFWNTVRMLASGLALLVTGLAVFFLDTEAA